ncbi:MAG: nitrile hydratase, beta subunit [uncultured archaeon A07HR60]|nr:MAG: nitrile hydratase, beta subunit [uncultured archaeon A07HR60]
MDGVHDVGGMHGFGSVDTDDDAAFHDDWEKAVFAVEKLLRYQSIYGVDKKRHALERLDPATYLDVSYFERWALGSEKLLLETDTISAQELESAREAHDGTGLFDHDHEHDEPDAPDSNLVGLVNETFRTDAAYDREPVEPEFEVGCDVIVRNDHPDGHTRCPGYARRAQGTIDAVQGTYAVPDEVAHGTEAAEPLYSVRFEAAELWNDDTDSDTDGDGDTVHIDLWERYLRPVETPIEGEPQEA